MVFSEKLQHAKPIQTVFSELSTPCLIMPPYFFKVGLKITGEVYRWVMAHVVKPWLKKAYPNSAS